MGELLDALFNLIGSLAGSNRGTRHRVLLLIVWFAAIVAAVAFVLYVL
jgi:hypothetical protein